MNELEKQSLIELYESHKILYTDFKKLEQENIFLRERENKLQMIEQLFLNEPVNLSELAKAIKGE